MKLLLLLTFLPFAAIAQPGLEQFMDPCATASYGVPLQDIARNDVQVFTYGVGTDDVPSSSGHCIRTVSCYENVQFLHALDRRTGSWLIVAPKAGDVLNPDSLSAGIAAGRLRWAAGTMPICHQGYGAQHDGKGWQLVEPRDWERSIVRIQLADVTYLVAMTVTYLEPDGIIDVRGGPAVLEGEPHLIR